ncbi:hypothetical protein B0H14DRAFT_2636846 [Mycena olivaceomarginata]|nr:hypothetical protein B0H14DRAFT_2636846 [Mycena olivaceomarginata]
MRKVRAELSRTVGLCPNTPRMSTHPREHQEAMVRERHTNTDGRSRKLLATVVEARRRGSENIPKKFAHPRLFGITYNGGWPLGAGLHVHKDVVDTRRARRGSVLVHLAPYETRRPRLLKLAVPITCKVSAARGCPKKAIVMAATFRQVSP